MELKDIQKALNKAIDFDFFRIEEETFNIGM